MYDTKFTDQALAQIVAGIVSLEFGVPMAEIFAKTKAGAHQSFVRQIAMYLVHITFGLNYSRISKAFSRDRSTVAYGCEVIEDSREDPVFDAKLEELEQFLACVPLNYLNRKAG
ncbi:MAG TPA: chromosomal replication initiator DnaA [Hellea balneolensis]|uniref:Chromosomal replication initiator DnaA n=1 Tax=Hellea balneolensis TaxID=287478 RepID=A0A7C5LUR2_9PROT|nr:chromosomal replication initiator DnaA [Hellea balneolensis]